jgi:hypothetical protein
MCSLNAPSFQCSTTRLIQVALSLRLLTAPCSETFATKLQSIIKKSGPGIALQAGRSAVRDPTKQFDFVNLSNPSGRTRPWVLPASNRNSYRTEIQYMFQGVRVWPVLEAGNLTAVCRLTVYVNAFMIR